MHDVFTTRGACDLLGIGPRQVRRLLKAKRLDTVGLGQARRITRESIEQYRAERNVDITPDMSFPMSASLTEHEKIMKQILKTLPALSPPRAAARRLGIPEAEFSRLLATGGVPSIALGTSRFI